MLLTRRQITMSDAPVVHVSLDQAKPIKFKSIYKEEKHRAASKPRRIWDNYRAIGEVRKSDKIKYVIGAGIRDGVRYINIREFYTRYGEDAWRPSKDGITIPIAIPVNNGTEIIHPYLDFISVLAQTAEALETMELEDEENAVWKFGGK